MRRHIPHIIALVTVLLLAFIGFRFGTLIDQQQQQIEDQTEAAERAEDRTRELKRRIADAVDEIRDEVRTPAGERAETHEAARRAEEGLRRALEMLEDIQHQLGDR